MARMDPLKEPKNKGMAALGALSTEEPKLKPTKNRKPSQKMAAPEIEQEPEQEKKVPRQLVDLAQQVESGQVPEEEADAVAQQILADNKELADYKTPLIFSKTPAEQRELLKKQGKSASDIKEEMVQFNKEYNDRSSRDHAYIKGIKTETKHEPHIQSNLLKITDLVKEGKNASSTSGAIVKALKEGVPGLPRIDLTSWLGSNTEQIEKLASDFITTTPKVGNKAMPQDLAKILMASYPAINQSDVAKLENANAQLVQSKVRELGEKEYSKLMKETKGKIPDDIELVIEDRIGPKRDELYDRWRKGESDIPNYQEAKREAEIREGGSVVAALLGALAGGAAGGAKGFKEGSKFGGWQGAVAGGLGGAALGTLGALGGAALGSEAMQGLNKWAAGPQGDFTAPNKR